jgi:hypothetical protein
MGWLYKSSLDGFKTPTEYLDHLFTFDREERSYRVLRSSLVQMRRYYAAVERVEKVSGQCFRCRVPGELQHARQRRVHLRLQGHG